MITTMDELLASLGAAQSLPFRKASLPGVPFGMSSLWVAPGVPGPGESPSALNGVFPSGMTPGALRFAEALGAEVSQIARAAATSSQPSQIIVYDRIWHGRVNRSSTARQAITWPTIGQRHADGWAVELFAEVTENLGGTAPATWTAEITDQDGVPGQMCTAAFDGSGTAGRLIPFDMPVEALGVQRVHSIQLSASHTSGGLNLLLARRIAEIGISAAGVGVVSIGADLGLPLVSAGACLGLMVAHGAGAESGAVFGRLEVVQS